MIRYIAIILIGAACSNSKPIPTKGVMVEAGRECPIASPGCVIRSKMVWPLDKTVERCVYVCEAIDG
jgi:hypothetical protein